jgi:hypothetical protein
MNDGRPSSSGLRGRRRIYPTILKLADHALFKMVRYVLLRPLRPELEIQLEQFKEASSKPAQLKAFSQRPKYKLRQILHADLIIYYYYVINII